MKLLFSLLWLIQVYIFIFIPLSLIALLVPSVTEFSEHGHGLLIIMVLPFVLFIGTLLLLLFIAIVLLLVPTTPTGRFVMFKDKGSTLWAINNAPVTLFLKWFQSTLFLNDHLRFLTLKCLGANVKMSSVLTTTTVISDLQQLTIGEHVMVGEQTRLQPSMQVALNQLYIAPIVIEDHVFLSGACIVGPKVTIREGAVINANVVVFPKVDIGKNAKIGAGSQLCTGCSIGEGAILGYCCTIDPHINIPKQTVLPNHSVITQENLNEFLNSRATTSCSQ